MKVTNLQLRQIIREELSAVLQEDDSVAVVKSVAMRVPGAHQWLAVIDSVNSVRDLYKALKKKAKRDNLKIPKWLIRSLVKANKMNYLARKNRRSMKDAARRPGESFAQYRQRLTGGDTADFYKAPETLSGDHKQTKIQRARKKAGAMKGMSAKDRYIAQIKAKRQS